jgi:hypothetical protein
MLDLQRLARATRHEAHKPAMCCFTSPARRHGAGNSIATVKAINPRLVYCAISLCSGMVPATSGHDRCTGACQCARALATSNRAYCPACRGRHTHRHSRYSWHSRSTARTRWDGLVSSSMCDVRLCASMTSVVQRARRWRGRLWNGKAAVNVEDERRQVLVHDGSEPHTGKSSPSRRSRGSHPTAIRAQRPHLRQELAALFATRTRDN